MSRPVLQVIVGSTRPGRLGAAVADWVADRARAQGAFDVELVDLADVDLPLYDEPHHPRLGRYEHEHTREWSATVSRADAFVWVIPEYNHSFSAAVKNALDYLHNEWAHKPAGMVSYGGVSGGVRAVQALQPVLSALRITPVPEGVILPFAATKVEDGVLRPGDISEQAADAMLDSLARMTDTLAPLRERTIRRAA